MIAIIFEVWPDEEHRGAYLDIAAELRPILEEVEGFISVERFQSITDPGKLLSIAFFEDETAVQRWRNIAEHRVAQLRGRSGIFKNYRLRVTSVIRDYGMNERNETPTDSLAQHDS